MRRPIDCTMTSSEPANSLTQYSRRQFAVALCAAVAAVVCGTGCASPDGLGPGATSKAGLQALKNEGPRLFASSTLGERNSGVSSFGGTVSVLRIPAAFCETAKARPGRFIQLQFRIEGELVLFTWRAQEALGEVWVDILNDGDFKHSTLYSGVVADFGWERPVR